MTDLIRKPTDGTLVDATARFPQQPTTDVYDQEQDTAVVALVAVDLPEDHEGDRPLRPLWTRDTKSFAAAGRRSRIRTRRAMRRWAGRQLTQRGHAAQAVRGIRLTHEWVHGFHGIHVQAAKHAAHTATRDARTATRRARFTMMPKERDVAQKQALTAQAAALDAVKLHKDARDRVRRGRLFRGAIAYGTPLALNGAAAMETGWLGLAGTTLATLAATAFIGRNPLTGETWDPERRSLGDGDPLTESMLDRAFTAAKIILDVQRLQMVSPCVIDPDQQNAWMALIDLPDGVTVDKVRSRYVELAAALGIDRSQLDLQQAGSDGRLALWACGTDPFLATRKSPLIGRTEPLNTWKDGIPIAFDKRGRIVTVTISDYSMIFAGATRSGKGMALANVLAGALLDPRVRIRLFDGKGSGEYVPFAPVLATFVRRNPRRLRDFLRVMVEEMNRRTEILVEMGVSKADESLLEKLGGIELVVVDELATYTAKEGPSKEYAEEITELLSQIAAVGASVGIVEELVTQFPEVGIIPSRLRGNCAGRLANRTETPSASNVILGDGMVGQGYDSSKIPMAKTARGRGWLTTPDTGVIEVRSLFIDEKTREIVPLIATGVEIRRKAGCLPGHYADPVEKELLRVTGASSAAGGPTGNGGIQRGTLLDHLVTAATQAGRGSLTSADAFTALADVDSRYARTEGEADAAWASRAGKALKAQLTDLGVTLEPSRVTAADGSRPNGYTLAALQTAADTARNARK
ncbi:FtsK/SpoIIIE domain-containing protein [Streptomyces sp. NPDC056352]|uniref:FtsK/SpoIIIE domain-containing protein n=1 Tax=Streptomyces sp. NPDC056352 TaxID=3345791 RepID=UPI0035DA4085